MTEPLYTAPTLQLEDLPADVLEELESFLSPVIFEVGQPTLGTKSARITRDSEIFYEPTTLTDPETFELVEVTKRQITTSWTFRYNEVDDGYVVINISKNDAEAILPQGDNTSESRTYYVDIGDIPKEQGFELISKFKSDIENKRI